MAFVLVELIVEAAEAVFVGATAGAEAAVTTIAEVTGATELATGAQAATSLASGDLAVAGGEVVAALGVTAAAVTSLGKPAAKTYNSTPDGQQTQKVLPAGVPNPAGPTKAGPNASSQVCYVPCGWSAPLRKRRRPAVSKRDLEVAVAALLLGAARRR